MTGLLQTPPARAGGRWWTPGPWQPALAALRSSLSGQSRRSAHACGRRWRRAAPFRSPSHPPHPHCSHPWCLSLISINQSLTVFITVDLLSTHCVYSLHLHAKVRVRVRVCVRAVVCAWAISCMCYWIHVPVVWCWCSRRLCMALCRCLAGDAACTGA